jgi:hypothetical protein
MDTGAELIAEGYSDSRIQAFGSQQRRFIEFCELDAYDLSEAGCSGPRSYLCDSRVESGRPTRGV